MPLGRRGMVLSLAYDECFPDEMQARLDASIFEIERCGDDLDSLPPKLRALYEAMPPGLDFSEYACDIEHQGEVVSAYYEQNWHGYVLAHPASDHLRFYALNHAVERGLRGAEYWQLLTAIYLEDTFIYDDFDQEDLRKYLELYRADMPPGRRATMTDAELTVFDALPEVVTVYRGAEHRHGMSWSLDVRVAESLANKPIARLRDAKVHTAQVPRSSILVYYGGRGEAEVLVDLVMLSASR